MAPASVSETAPLLAAENQFRARNQRRSTSTEPALAPYTGYGTADWLRALVQSSHAETGAASRWWTPAAQGWLAACLVGGLTALVAFIVDVGVETLSDWKTGRCTATGGFWLSRRACCVLDDDDDGGGGGGGGGGACRHWRPWADSFSGAYLIYVATAVAFGVVASALSMTTRHELVVDAPDAEQGDRIAPEEQKRTVVVKTMYMATGSGIPEIKSVLSGFDIPHLLSLKVMVVKSVGAIFAVATAMCLGKEGPFVHISACIGHLVSRWLPAPDRGGAENAMRAREALSVACSAGLSVAFGAPIGGVLFSYEEISTYFPRRVLWRAFLCSLVAAAALRELNPAGTGKLVLFETSYGVNYDAAHYAVFALLGVCGGVFGGVFCAANALWSRTFRQLPLIRRSSPVLEVGLVALATALLQYPNPLIRETGDKVMERLLVDCNSVEEDWICAAEARTHGRGIYYAWLVSGTLVKLVLTIITFGCKVPSGVIIPALDAGALFGRMVGQLVPSSSPGVFAMVGSAAFLAGVCRMTVSLAVIMFELTGEVGYVPPFMVAILTAKWVADVISPDGVYDVAQSLVGHPCLDAERALETLRRRTRTHPPLLVEALLTTPPDGEGDDALTLRVTPERQASASHLRGKLAQAAARNVLEPGFAMVNDRGTCCGHVWGGDLRTIVAAADKDATAERGGVVDLSAGELSELVDGSPVCVSAKAPIEHAVEMFGKLGVAYVAVVADGSSQFVGMVTRKDLLRFLDSLE
ncbi:Chloride channel, core [Cordyceps fumosorosea ARSEF 2679]|uniref:Chloride channel protein n=1 Tax=Cordyceps fumosorosea (strain ARSEF 2679) TaxID=1081104 RepID=A0A167V344_CORFA|nr:Chloride channel, core [Cordyceps fumosorosea ARSEF 2679]OAA62183.1 Chloride channel, core [Cordyceps fumosorosea ARSEF 2679]